MNFSPNSHGTSTPLQSVTAGVNEHMAPGSVNGGAFGTAENGAIVG